MMSDRTRNDRLLTMGVGLLYRKKIANPVHERKAALLYVRDLADRMLQEIAEEMGHRARAEQAIGYLPSFSATPNGEEMGQGPSAVEAIARPPSSSPSPTGEQEGHCVRAEEATVSLPPVSPASSDDVSHVQGAGSGQEQLAPSSTPKTKAGEGQGQIADNGQRSPAPPALVPTPAQRAGAARAMRVAPKAVARTIFDTLKVRGNIAIGDVRYGALTTIQRADEWEASFVEGILALGIPSNRSMRVRDYLTPAQVLSAKKYADKRFHNAA